MEASKTDFKDLTIRQLHVQVTETVRLELGLQLAIVVEQAQVISNQLMVELDTAALGKATNEETIHELPLATRNFSRLAGLSAGVVTGVYNAGELGIGGTALSEISSSYDGLYVHGTRSYDNNWQLDGISVSDVLSTSTSSGGIPIPNPDAVREFKVQTGVYGAGVGRAAGSKCHRDHQGGYQSVPRHIQCCREQLGWSSAEDTASTTLVRLDNLSRLPYSRLLLG